VEDVELGCDEKGNCAYYSVERHAYYALKPDGSHISGEAIIKLLKKLGFKVRKSGDKIAVRTVMKH